VRKAFAQRLDGGAIMDAKSFRRLCATLGSLTGPQLKELWTALRSLDARMQAIGAIEKRREGAVACPHCSRDRSTRWGSTRTGVQRMRCPSCRRTFSSSTGTAVARIHSPARFHQVVADMFCDHPRSCRGLGRALGLDKMTIWRWRQKIIRALAGSGASNLGGVVEADEKFFRESSEAGSDALGGLQTHENETAGRYLEVSDPGPHDGGSRGRQARGRIARPQCPAADGRARTMLARRCGPLQRP
jgi:transposase-like protein